jgi:hypothetical protein
MTAPARWDSAVLRMLSSSSLVCPARWAFPFNAPRLRFRGAHKTAGFVHIPGTLVSRCQRICAKGSGHHNFLLRSLSREFRGDDAGGSCVVFDRRLQGEPDIVPRVIGSECGRRTILAEAVRARPFSAMPHSRNHVEPRKLIRAGRSHLPAHCVLVVDRAHRRNRGVAPALIKNQLLAVVSKARRLGSVAFTVISVFFSASRSDRLALKSAGDQCVFFVDHVLKVSCPQSAHQALVRRSPGNRAAQPSPVPNAPPGSQPG